MSAKILAIHDRARSQSEIKGCLETSHEVTVYSSIEFVKQQLSCMGLTDADKMPFDIIICAVHLNDSSGGNAIDFLRWLREQSHVKDVPFLLLCNRQGLLMEKFFHTMRTACSALGAAGFLMVDDFSGPGFLQDVEQFLPITLQGSTTAGAPLVDTHLAIS